MTREGPEAYRLARAYPPEAAAALLERALGEPPAWVLRDDVGGSHAVYFAGLSAGDEVVLRVATHPEHDLDRELWAQERCRLSGVPIAPVLAAHPKPAAGSLPHVILRRVPGVPAHQASLTPAQRAAVLEQLGGYAALIHRIALHGFGPLRPTHGGYEGRFPSLRQYLAEDLEERLQALPATVLTSQRAATLRGWWERVQEELDQPTGSLIHGDYRFKNVLLHGSRIGAILDFEMAVAADPAMDLAHLMYADGKGEGDQAAILSGYRAGAGRELGAGLARRLLIYQISYALGHLWWEVELDDATGVTRTLNRIDELEEALARC
jgi:aminoglycoside phosphotransferase (APT) family kinase protein